MLAAISLDVMSRVVFLATSLSWFVRTARISPWMDLTSVSTFCMRPSSLSMRSVGGSVVASSKSSLRPVGSLPSLCELGGDHEFQEPVRLLTAVLAAGEALLELRPFHPLPFHGSAWSFCHGSASRAFGHQGWSLLLCFHPFCGSALPPPLMAPFVFGFLWFPIVVGPQCLVDLVVGSGVISVCCCLR